MRTKRAPSIRFVKPTGGAALPNEARITKTLATNSTTITPSNTRFNTSADCSRRKPFGEIAGKIGMSNERTSNKTGHKPMPTSFGKYPSTWPEISKCEGTCAGTCG